MLLLSQFIGFFCPNIYGFLVSMYRVFRSRYTALFPKKTPTLGGLMKKRNGDKEKQKEGEKSKKSKQKT